MKLTIKKIIGQTTYPFTFEGENLHKCVMESKKLSFPNVYECGECHSKNLILNAYVTEKDNFEYTEIKCLECKSKVVFGQQRKDSNVFFLRKNDDKTLKWEKYEGNSENQQKPRQEESYNDDPPF